MKMGQFRTGQIPTDLHVTGLFHEYSTTETTVNSVEPIV